MTWVAVDIGETVGTSVIDVPDHLSPADMERGFLVEFGAKDGQTIVIGLYRWKDGFVPRESKSVLLVKDPDLVPDRELAPMNREPR